MIQHFRVQNYKALRDVSLNLLPMSVLIGPNDSGKTSITEALAALCRSVDHPLHEAFLGPWEGNALVWQGAPDEPVAFEAVIASGLERIEYRLACRFAPRGRKVAWERETARTENRSVDLPRYSDTCSVVQQSAATGQSHFSEEVRLASKAIHDALSGVHYYRWDPRFLALPVAPDTRRRYRMEATGFGLALCLDEILGFDRARFDELEQRFRAIFPQVKSIKLVSETAYKSPPEDAREVPMLQPSDGKGVYLQLTTGGLVSAAQISDGMLLILAYLTVLHLPQPPRLILIEEPENGIHPKRLQDVLTIVRGLVEEQRHTQVVLTTHSPYVVDLFVPEEVHLCRKQEDGTVAVHHLSQSRSVREQLDVFTLGEIWTAEGDEKLARSVGSQKGEGDR